MHFLAALTLCCLLSYHGHKRGSLSTSGAIAAFFIGMATFTHPSYLFTTILLAFYLSSSRLTKLGAHRKSQVEESYAQASRRTAVQVFSNGVTGTAIAVLHHLMVGDQIFESCYFGREGLYPLGVEFDKDVTNRVLIAAFIGHYACCNGDTWASELGILSPGLPRLITNFKSVPPGTNGGVTIVGLLASFLGGAFIGSLAGVTLFPWQTCLSFETFTYLTVLGGFCGLVGSLIDSVLGATLQRTRLNKRTQQITPDFRRPKEKEGEKASDFEVVSGLELLDNHQVNFISSLVVAFLAGLFARVFGGN